MSQTEAIELVRATMSEMFELAPDTLVPDARLIEDLGLDSIDAIDMAARMHEITGVRVEDQELRALATVADVVALLGLLRARA
jgi:acyl carrier protein